ncbi:MAG: hypothetical protein DRI54_02920 [Bacteroidetes bacterium]|nr:MAG: hypothetical protein DRI54_02920 [Bacteroidota bacterium]
MKTLLNFRMMAMGLFIFLIAGNNLTAQTNWVKHENNPVMDNFDSDDWDRYYFNPIVLVIENELSMWYLGTNDNSPNQIGYAYSTNGGITWISNDEPVIAAGNTGDWNRNKIPNTVLLDGDTLKMWYNAFTGGSEANLSIGYAWRHIDSTDWILNEDPVLEKGSSGEWDFYGIWTCSVHFDGEVYHMWYHGYEEDVITEPGHMGYATSPNGVDWDKHPDNPVMEIGADGSFYDTYIIPGPVRFSGGQFEMWFTGWDGDSNSPYYFEEIGYMTSVNGKDWVIQNDTLPVLNVGSPGDWDRNQVRVASVVTHNDSLKMFFMGHKPANGYQIGLATEDMVDGVRDLDQLSEFEMIISPNPIKDITTISYHLTSASTTSIVIYNQQGQIISTLLDEKKQSGDHEIIFDSKGLPSGIYFCVLKANDETQTAKIVKL